VTVAGLLISGTNAGDYALASTSASGAVGAVTAAPLTVTADAQSRTYGAANPALTHVSSGLVNGDTLTGALATSATATSDVGPKLIAHREPNHETTWNAVCLADFGDSGVAFAALPQIPPRIVNWSSQGY